MPECIEAEDIINYFATIDILNEMNIEIIDSNSKKISVYPRNANKVKKIFEKLVDKIKEGNNMNEYEEISPKCKMLWREGFEVITEKYTQVSGYIFDEENQILIVKSGDVWTIPGGHPELFEMPKGTLIREVLEEASVTIKNIQYLGAVEVIENGQKYYQVRYFAKVDSVLPFNNEFETSERKFVPLSELDKYIKWANGITFSSQIKSAVKMCEV